jgi:hypothetical protein
MYIERLQEEISGLIEKIKLDWGRMKNQSPGIHKIDKDIITNDIRRLYDLIYEVDLGNPVPKIRKMPEPSTAQNVMPPESESQDPTSFENETIVPASLADSESGDIDEVVLKRMQTEEIVVQTMQTDKIEVHLAQKLVESEVFNSPAAPERFQQNENSLPDFDRVAEKPQPTRQKQVHKSTIDLFTAPKTIADIFQNSSDNSYAARMQKNPIDDIKSAIGINEKFLFINTIFDGEISLYNKVIDRLNELPDFYLALHYIDELKANYEKETNRDAFVKLLEIVKRKYL